MVMYLPVESGWFARQAMSTLIDPIEAAEENREVIFAVMQEEEGVLALRLMHRMAMGPRCVRLCQFCYHDID